MLSCSIWFSAPSLCIDGGLESCCVGRVYGADGAVHQVGISHCFTCTVYVLYYVTLYSNRITESCQLCILFRVIHADVNVSTLPFSDLSLT